MPTAKPSTPLENLDICAVDVETTGLDSWSGDRVCEIAVVRYHGLGTESEVEVGRFSTLISSPRIMSPRALAVNGITADLLLGAPDFAAIAPSVLDLLSGAALLGHNVRFDVGFLVRELELAGLSLPEEYPLLDTLELSRRNLSLGRNSLESVALALGVQPPTHRALDDALATARCFSAITQGVTSRRLAASRKRLSDIITAQGGPIGWPRRRQETTLPADLAEAWARGRPIRLWYLSVRGEETVRVVEPIQLIEERGEVSMVCFCHLRLDKRTFRLSRVLRWETAEEAIDFSHAPQS